MRVRTRAALALLLAVSTGACAPHGPTPEEILALRREVNRLGDSLSAAGLGPGALVAGAGAERDEVVIGLRTSMVMEVVSAAARAYLGDVRLHLRDDVVVGAGDDVRVDLGLFEVTAGSWELEVTIERIDAVLRADSILLSVPDSQRLAVTVPVHVVEGTGEAVIDFRWDASRAAGVVCGDFAIRERFAGTVEPRTHLVEGHFRLERDSVGLRAVPVVENRVSVSPRPTAAAWRRVRAILSDQDRIFNCGLAISKEGMEEMLRELLDEGFRFRLPSSILRPVPLPASLTDRVHVAGRSAEVVVEARPPRLDPSWLWLAARVGLRE